MKLTPRLQAVADFVPHGAVLADVGTDHAYLPVALLESGCIEKAIASDIRPGPLERAEQTVKRAGLEEKISLRLCPGLLGIGRDECTTIAIAGMGGEMIAEIVQQAPWTADGFHVLVLQPMTAPEKLRKALIEMGFLIQEETLAREGEKIYVILRAVGGGVPQNKQTANCLVSEKLRGNPLEREYYAMLRFRYNKAVAGIQKMAGARALNPDEIEIMALQQALAKQEEGETE